ncbi:hypothetical protein IFM89_030531 [Coptis chinensis]|uniref:Uncharacterized protein n=1 Tax=Coptis chinensis TaxID=261450 RepID=A0A835HR04_9MAGN|nr:hypothetical protein IFM89_030531 [Coptis chinensis]
MTEVGTKTAPIVGSYSSRGPNSITAEILKPDVIAPGTSILAASTNDTSGTTPPGPTYKFSSGTSMAAPHVAGVAGQLKALYPDWSPAMIHSAIITTASTIDNTNQPIKDHNGKPATPFDMGAGHIMPQNATDPGLVYDLTFEDYLRFLCTQQNINAAHLSKLSKQPFQCPNHYNLLNFNYPSITVPNLSGSIAVSRTVKNIGTPGNYSAYIEEPHGIYVTITPDSLLFKEIGEEKNFTLTFRAKKDLRTKSLRVWKARMV